MQMMRVPFRQRKKWLKSMLLAEKLIVRNQARFQASKQVTDDISLVSIRVGLKGSGIYDSLVIDELVTFVIGEGVE